MELGYVMFRSAVGRETGKGVSELYAGCRLTLPSTLPKTLTNKELSASPR